MRPSPTEEGRVINMFLLVKLHIDMGLEAVMPGPQNALYVMLCYVMLKYLTNHTS